LTLSRFADITRKTHDSDRLRTCGEATAVPRDSVRNRWALPAQPLPAMAVRRSSLRAWRLQGTVRGVGTVRDAYPRGAEGSVVEGGVAQMQSIRDPKNQKRAE